MPIIIIWCRLLLFGTDYNYSAPINNIAGQMIIRRRFRHDATEKSEAENSAPNFHVPCLNSALLLKYKISAESAIIKIGAK